MLPMYRHICDLPERIGCDVVSRHVVDPGSDEIRGRDERSGDVPEGHQASRRERLSWLQRSRFSQSVSATRYAGRSDLGCPSFACTAPGRTSLLVLGNPNMQRRVREYASTDDLEQIPYEFVGVSGDSND